MKEQNQSELARLLAEIDERNRAARAGLSGYAVVSAHDSIVSRMEQGAVPVLELFRQGRYEDAVRMWERSASI